MKYMDNGMAEVNIRDGKDMAEAMSAFVNSFSIDEKGFIKEMANKHRTLQQSFTRLCWEWLKTLSAMYEKGNYDLRNEASCKLANKIVKQFKEEGYFPMV